MLVINNTYTDPYFNIAAERYLLHKSMGDVFMLWQNEPSVIIGKHQQVHAEVDLDLANEKQIKVVRRMSGGGAVYNDMGNVNLTFIETNSSMSFSKFPQMMIDFLATIGITAEVDKRLGLTIDGLKISGSAQYVYKTAILFHATLLFSSDLALLKAVLEGVPVTEKTKYVQSVKSPVTNISQHLPYPISLEVFKEKIINHFLGTRYTFSEQDIIDIEKIQKEQL